MLQKQDSIYTQCSVHHMEKKKGFCLKKRRMLNQILLTLTSLPGTFLELTNVSHSVPISGHLEKWLFPTGWNWTWLFDLWPRNCEVRVTCITSEQKNPESGGDSLCSFPQSWGSWTQILRCRCPEIKGPVRLGHHLVSQLNLKWILCDKEIFYCLSP